MKTPTVQEALDLPAYLREVGAVEDAAGLPSGLLVPVHDAHLLHGGPQVGGVAARAERLRQVAGVELPLHAVLHPVRIQVQLGPAA